MKKIFIIYLLIVGVLFSVGMMIGGSQMLVPALKTLGGIIVAELAVAVVSWRITVAFFYDPYPGTSGSIGVFAIRAALSLCIWPLGTFAAMLSAPFWAAIITCAIIMAVLNFILIMICYKFGREPRMDFEFSDEDEDVK